QAETGVVVAYIHEDFVAGGKTLPAGTYKVYRGSPETGQVLILSGEKGSVFLIPSARPSRHRAVQSKPEASRGRVLPERSRDRSRGLHPSCSAYADARGQSERPDHPCVWNQ